MATISLKISIPEKNAVKTMQLEPSLLVYEACAVIAQKIADVNQALGSPKEYGLFSIDEDSTKKTGRWLEPGRTLDYYMLRNGVSNFIFFYQHHSHSLNIFKFFFIFYFHTLIHTGQLSQLGSRATTVYYWTLV